MNIQEIAMYVLKGLAILGLVLNVVLMLRKNKQIRANTEVDPILGKSGQEVWQEGMKPKNFIATSIIGFVANFFDTLGIGSFAPSSAAFKMTKSVDDTHIPGTLNVGDTVAVCMEAFLFFSLVEMDILTLVLMVLAAAIGAKVMAGIVSKFDRKKVRYAMFIGLFILAIIMLCKQLGVGPFGMIGTAVKLRGYKLVIAVVVNFVLGALMSIGVGLYAPCMALCALLGLNVACAFPAMMGSCAYLMAFGNGPQFIKEGRYDPIACLTQAIFGAIGVIIAYVFVSSLPLNILTWIVIAVVFITSFLFLHDAIKKGSNA